MKTSALEQYRCPACRGGDLKLTITEAIDGDVMEGELECPECAQQYAVKGGIPRFVPASNYADSFGFQWNVHARTQLDSYSGIPISADRLFGVTRWDRNLTGQKILEAGSGAGRFTEVILGTGADLFSFDYSTAVDANWANNRQKGKLNLFQGDIFNIPLEQGSFDKVMCLGVLQHTPDPAAAFRSLAKYVKPGGQLAVDVYTRDLASLIQWKYLLRPITRRMTKEKLYRLIERATPPLVPVAAFLRSIAGRFGGRLLPIVQYAHLGLPPKLNVQWAILDTFDMYSPAHDHPHSIATVKHWYETLGFTDVDVRHGPNGVVATGTRPAESEPAANR
jgi:SAM-dependent methyltransferase